MSSVYDKMKTQNCRIISNPVGPTYPSGRSLGSEKVGDWAGKRSREERDITMIPLMSISSWRILLSANLWPGGGGSLLWSAGVKIQM